MRFREPLLGGSAAMPGASLQRACRLLVAVCALHLGVTLVYYLSGRDLSRLPYLVGVPPPPQAGQPPGELRPPGAAPPPAGATAPPRRGGSESSPVADPRPGLASNLTAAPGPPATALPRPACPEESPLLGKDSVGARGGLGLPAPDFPDRPPSPPPSRTCALALPPDSQPPRAGAVPPSPKRLRAGWGSVVGRRVSPFGFTGEAGGGGGRGVGGEAAGPTGPRTREKKALETSLLWPQPQAALGREY